MRRRALRGLGHISDPVYWTVWDRFSHEVCPLKFSMIADKQFAQVWGGPALPTRQFDWAGTAWALQMIT